MRNQRMLPVLATVLLAVGLLAAPAWLGAQSSVPVKMEWLSWSHFRFTSPTGKVILTNPFTTNPDSPIKAADITKADIILVADGHGDEVGASDEIAIKTGAKVIAAGEMMRNYFEPRKLPPDQFLSAGPSDWYRFDGLTVRIVNAVHGSGTPDKTYGGPALGFMVHFENGLTVYFSGSTGLTMDMQLWGSLYKPDVAILSLASRRDPQDIVHMVRLLRTDNPNLKTVIPHHHRLQPPPGAPTVADMEGALRASGMPVRVLNPELSRAYELTK